MRVLTVLTYYRPHTSGLTLYAQRLARAQAQRGHDVTVLTTRHEHGLPTESEEAGVRVVRTPVWFRLGKGVISPALYFRAASLIRDHDVVLLHLPQFDGAGIALLARLHGLPLVVTYHCDLLLPPGLGNRLVNAVMWMADRITGTLAAAVVAYTEDFAAHSPFLRRFAGKCRTVLPPVPPLSAAAAPLPEVAEHIHSAPILGMATRFASEKGIEILLDALPTIERQHPGVKVLFAGQYQDVWGEQTYLEKLLPRIRVLQEQGRWRFLGVLDPGQMPAFYAALDLLLVPSLNSTESFGLVQIEAMQCGCRVVASDLPGVRQPVRLTGLGRVVPVGDPGALARAVLELLDEGIGPGVVPRRQLQDFDPDHCAASYDALFAELLAR